MALFTFGSGSIPKWPLWSDGTKLRGANMYQQDNSPNNQGGNFGPLLTENDLRALRAAGANYVTFSVPGILHVRKAPGAKRYELWKEMENHLDRMILWAARAGLFAVISLRTGPGRGEGHITGDGLKDSVVFKGKDKDKQEAQQAWVEMWKLIAAKYSSKAHVVGYDLMCEPKDISKEQWRNFAQSMVTGIRSVDKETPILVSPGELNSVDALTQWPPLSPPAASYLVYNVHQYEPDDYTQGRYNKVTRKYSDSDLVKVYEELDSTYAKITGWLSRNQGQCIAVNEFGILKDQRSTAAFMERQLKQLEELRINYAIWLWEVSATYDAGFTPYFDFKENAELYSVIKTYWKKNTIYFS